MSLSIIHLSDIHIKSDKDLVLCRISELKRACASVIAPGNDVLLLISGDIAFSGQEQQYELAFSLINELAEYLVQQRNVSMHYAFVPGNHDCDFSTASSFRGTLMSGVATTQVDAAYYDEVAKVQKNYWDFFSIYGMDTNKLVSKIEFEVQGNRIAVLLVNTAWMSELHENPGKIIMPGTLYENINSRDYKAIFSVFHHPVSWMNPDHRTDFLNYVRTVTDIAFVGHEHQRDQFTTIGGKWSFEEIHAKELQDSNSSSSAFGVYSFDAVMQGYDAVSFNWSQDEAAYVRESTEHRYFQKNIAAFDSVYHPNKNTIEDNLDVGLAIRHFAKDDVSLPDLFVWPELNRLDFANDHAYQERITDNILGLATEGRISIFTGAMSSGKSSLVKMIYLSFVDEQVCCVSVAGEEFTSADSNKINAVVEKAFVQQYDLKYLEGFRQLPNEQKVIIIDDVDCMRIHGERRNSVIDYLYGCFGKVILMYRSEMDVHSLLAADCLKGMEEVPAYKLLPMGNRKRTELIRKWYNLNNDTRSESEIEQLVENGVNQVNTFLGNGTSFIPAHPVFIISVLQNSDAAVNIKFSGSKYGYLYESLIQHNLSTVGAEYQQTGAQNIDVGIVSALAFYLLQGKNEKVFTEDEFEAIVQGFAHEKKIQISKSELLRRMLDTKIFKEVPGFTGMYRFRYPYMFYFFAGRYIAYNPQQELVQKMVEHMSGRLYNEDYGNIIIFVCHFANSQKVIEEILGNAYVTLDNYQPFVFEKSNPLFDDIQSVIEALLPENVGSNEDVREHQSQKLRTMDAVGVMDGHVEEGRDTIDEEANMESDLVAVTASIKTLEVLGQILQNYPADIEGQLKVDIIAEIHSLGMRAVQAIVETMGYAEEGLVNAVIERAKENNKTFSRDEIVLATRKFVTMLISGMVSGMVHMVASTMNSPFLLVAATEALANENTISAQLVLQELKMNYLKRPDVGALEKLNNELLKANNRFAQFVLTNSVSNYLRYNQCDYRVRSRLCQTFKLSEKKAYLLSQKTLSIEGK